MALNQVDLYRIPKHEQICLLSQTTNFKREGKVQLFSNFYCKHWNTRIRRKIRNSRTRNLGHWNTAGTQESWNIRTVEHRRLEHWNRRTLEEENPK